MKKSVWLAATVVSSLLSGSAGAVSITNNFSLPSSPSGYLAPNSGTALDETGSVSGVYRSPFEGTAFFGAAYDTIGNGAPYATDSATFNAPKGSDDLSILWGSVDSYNSIAFYSAQGGVGPAIYTVTGATLIGMGATNGLGYDLVNIALGQQFGSVVFTSTQNAFEFSNLAFAAPLPPTWTMLLAGFAGLAFASYYRGRDKTRDEGRLAYAAA